MRTLVANDTSTPASRVFFYIRLLDNTPALLEAGGQPQVLINGGSWNSVGIGPLISQGFGSYYADLDPLSIQVIGDIIQTRYFHSGVTLEVRGDTFQIISSDGTGNAQPTVAANAYSAYSDVNEADSYFANKLNRPIWQSSPPDQKLIALREATQLIDRLNFQGEKADSEQLLQFPRAYTTIDTRLGTKTTVKDVVVPTDIKFACYEIAYKLIDGVDPDMEIGRIGKSTEGYSNIKVAYNPTYVPEHTLAGIPSAVAWRYLFPYLRDPRRLSIIRQN